MGAKLWDLDYLKCVCVGQDVQVDLILAWQERVLSGWTHCFVQRSNPCVCVSHGSASLFAAEPIAVRQPPLRSHVHKQQEKTTRVRTVLNEKQLHTLRTCYGANPRPDALMKEQLVEMTGLSPRVIRVWFQNKRCKDKKKTIFMKQMQQQQNSDKTVSNRGHK